MYIENILSYLCPSLIGLHLILFVVAFFDILQHDKTYCSLLLNNSMLY